METILDQSRDLNGRESYRLDSLYGTPDFVKNASLVERCGDGEMQPHLYADQSRRLYPTHTAAATYTSAMFFFDKRASFPDKVAEDIERRLYAAASFRGMRSQIEALHRKVAEANSADDEALTDDDFGFVGVDRAGRKERRLPMRNAVEVKEAADWLAKYRHDLDYRDRQAIARKVLQKAARYGAAIGDREDMLEKVAGFGMCAAKVAAELVRGRAKIAASRDKTLAGELQRTADRILELPHQAHSTEFLQRLAETIDTFDKMAGVRREYGKLVQPPEDVLFALNKKTASAALDSTISVGGKLYAKEDFARLRTQDVRDHLGDDLAEMIDRDGLNVDPEKVAELVPTMPRPDLETFDHLVAKAGLVPFRKEASARRAGLSTKAVAALASATGT